MFLSSGANLRSVTAISQLTFPEGAAMGTAGYFRAGRPMSARIANCSKYMMNFHFESEAGSLSHNPAFPWLKRRTENDLALPSAFRATALPPGIVRREWCGP